METPRFLLTAGASGSGKTLITCGILQALKNRGLSPASFKCGPDYIDPMKIQESGYLFYRRKYIEISPGKKQPGL